MTGIGENATAPVHEERWANAPSPPESAFILPCWMRRLCFCAGILVAYAQFVSLAFAAFFRYVYPYQEDPDGYIGEWYMAWILPSPEASVSTVWDFSPSETAICLAAAAIVALLGSAGLFSVARARAGRARRWRLIIGSMVGGVMPIVVVIFDILNSLERTYHFRYDETYLQRTYPLHGAFEFIGGVALPLLLYPVLILWLLLRGGKRPTRTGYGSE